MRRWTILEGDVRERIVELADESVDCVVTSVPYWGLRKYGAGKKEIGRERTLEKYLAIMVQVFEQVRRVLSKRGTLWLNIGDTYITSRKGPRGESLLLGSRRNANEALKLTGIERKADGLKRKDMVGLPWRVAFALQAAGWYLRSDIVWEKPSVTPESVKDRPTKEHEYVFLMSKSRCYDYDWKAIAEPCISTDGIRNARSVWEIAQVPEDSDHTATFPPELARRCILAGCPVDGIVLDPFAGVATAGVEALKSRRRFVGIELYPDHCAEARDNCVAALEARGEATVEDAEQKRGPTQLGLLAGVI